MKRFLFLAALLGACLCAKAYFEVGGLRYEVTSEEAKTCRVVRLGYGVYYQMEDVWIPDEVYHEGNYYRVTKIDDAAFIECMCTSMRLPSGLEELGYQACAFCQRLEEIELPGSLTAIGTRAFQHCQNLRTVRIPYSVSRIDDYAFLDCWKLESVDLPNVESVGEGAFQNCNSLRSLHFSYNFRSFGRSAFPYENIESISIDGGNPNFDCRSNCNGLVESATATMVMACKNTKIPSSVTRLGDWLFRGFGFETYDVPNHITGLGKGVFDSCKNLKSVTIPSGVTELDDYLFNGCSSMTEFTIPDQITRLGGWVLTGTGIEEIVIPASTVDIANKAFSECPKLKALRVDEANAKYDSRDNCNSLIETQTDALIILATPNSFIPEGVKVLTSNCIDRITLDYLEVPESVVEVREGAFCRSNIKKIKVLCTNAQWHDYYAFDPINNNSTVYSVQLPEGMTEINFSLPSSLSVLIIPSTVEKLRATQFNHLVSCGYYTKNLHHIVCLAKTPPMPNWEYGNMSDPVFYPFDNYEDCTLYVPKGCGEAYRNHPWEWSKFKEIKELTAGDVNADGNRNTADVVAIYSYIINGTESGIIDYFADVDENLKVNTADVVNVYKLIIDGDAGQ